MIEPILSDQGRKSSCPDCGYSWTTGADGSHECMPSDPLIGSHLQTFRASVEMAGSKPISSVDLAVGVQQWLQSQFAALRPADPAITELIAEAKSLDVSNPSARTFAADLQKDLKRRRESWEAQIKKIKLAIDALKKPVLDLEKRETQKYIDAADALSAKCTRYDEEIARKVREENEKRIREAEAKAKADQAAAIAAAKKAAEIAKQQGDEQARKEAAAKARELAASEPVAAPVILEEAPKLDNQHYRDSWEVEITDFALIPQRFKDAAQDTPEFRELVLKQLVALVKQQRTLFSQPGCKAHNRRKLITKL